MYKLELVDHVCDLCVDDIDLVNRCHVDKFYNFIHSPCDVNNLVSYRKELLKAKIKILPLFTKRVTAFRKKLMENN